MSGWCQVVSWVSLVISLAFVPVMGMKPFNNLLGLLMMVVGAVQAVFLVFLVGVPVVVAYCQGQRPVSPFGLWVYGAALVGVAAEAVCVYRHW